MAKKIETIAKALIKRNPELVTIVENHPGSSYKALEPRITTRLCGKIGKKEETFVQRNKLIWAIINCVADEDEDELDY